jgi:predicted dehydrogenase
VDGVEAVAVADVDARRASEVAGAHDIARVHPDGASLAADPEVDLVAVCVPPRHHAQGALAALEAGKHVLVEKPLCLGADEADALVHAAAGHPGRVCAVGFNLRVHRQVRAAAEAIAAGRLGRLRMLRSHWTAAGRPLGWRTYASEGGAVLWEMGIHHLDLWRRLTGEEPERIAATGHDGALALTATSPGGTLLATTVADGTSDANELEIVGERGRLTLTLYRGDGPHWAPTGEPGGGVGVRLRKAARAVRTLPRQTRAARAGGDYMLSFGAEWEAVSRAVHGELAGPPASFEDGRRAVLLARAAERALRANDEVEVGA